MSVCIPPKTSKTVVFPFNEQSNTFETDFYDPGLLDNQVSFEELNQFISEINGEYKLYKKGLVKEKLNDCFACSIVLILNLYIYAFIFHSNNDPQSLLTITETIILTSVLSLFICVLCGCRLDELDVLSQMKGNCQDLVDQQNEILRSRDLKWHLPDQFPAWIELTKDMKKRNNHLEIAAQAPIYETTENLIIFPRQRYISQKKQVEISRFSQDFYPLEMADERISSEEIQRFLCEINTYLRRPFKVFYRDSFIAYLCLSLELFGFLYISNHFPELLTTKQIILPAAISVFLTLCISGYEFEREDNKKIIRKKLGCQEIADKYNEALQNHGLRWRLPDEFPSWIELHKSSGNQDLDRQPIDHPKDPAEARNQNITHRKFKTSAYVPLLEDGENDKSFIKFRSTANTYYK